MRDSVTADDLAIESAKQKLVELANRDEYKAAIARVQTPERGPKVTVILLFALSGLGAVTLGWLGSGIAAWIGVVILTLFTLFMGFAWLGLALEKPSQAFGVAVVGKLTSGKNNEITELELLRIDGERTKAIVTDTIFDLVKPGDIGVAWLRKESSAYVVTDLERL